jgi:hypothetical protein
MGWRLMGAVVLAGVLGGGGLLGAGQDGEATCPVCAFGPVTLAGGPNQPAVFTFSADPDRPAKLWARALPRGQVSAAFRLNGLFLGPVQGELQPLSGLVRFPADLETFNVLEVFLNPDAGRLQVQIRYQGPRLPLEERPCPEEGPTLTALPARLEQIFGIVPLGSVNPPEHTFPTHHIYFYGALPGVGGPPAPVEIFAPVRATVVGAIRHVADDGSVDYELHMKPCREVRLYVIHVTRLAPALERRVPAFDDLCLPGRGFCAERTRIPVVAGQRLGTFDSHRVLAFDLGLIDMRGPPNAFANPGRYRLPDALLAGLTEEQLELVDVVAPDDLHQRCPVDYFTDPLRRALEARLGALDGSVRRTALPLCGTFVQDVAGGAPGNWFAVADHTVFEESHGVALVRDHLDPSIPVLSVGRTVPGLEPGVYGFPMAADPGATVNADFDAIVPGRVYCYEALSHFGAPAPGILLLELFAVEGAVLPDSLRLEYLEEATECPTVPAFTDAAVVFQR